MFFRRKKPMNAVLGGSTTKPARTTRDTSSWLILAALVFAVLAGTFVAGFLKAAVPSATAYVAKTDITPGEVITANMLDTRKLPAVAVPQDRITDKEMLFGKHARTHIAAGDPLRNVHLIELDAGSLAARLALESNPNLRAAALPKEASEGLKAEFGDRVDIYGFIPVHGENVPVKSELLISGAPVLAATEREKDTGQETGIVVAVTPESASKISTVLGLNGKLYVVLTPPGQLK